MNTISKISTAVAAMALVSACGGTATPVVMGPPDPIALSGFQQSVGPTPINYSPNLGILNLNNTSVTDPRETESVTNGNASAFRSGAPLTYSVVAQNGDAYAVSAATQSGTNARGQTFGGRIPGELAQTGTATFSGDYAAVMVRDAQGGLSQIGIAFVDGDVSLNVNLADNTLTGDITNRMSYNVSTGVVQGAPTAFADAQIVGGTIAANGTFQATVTGGERTFSGGTYTVDSGSANGTFAGVTGNSAAGVVSINMVHPTNTNTYTELGSFLATRD